MRIIQRPYRMAMILDMADEFSYVTRKEFSSALETLKQAKCPHVILNFRQVTFVDSAALGLLALAAQQFKAEHRKLSLVSPQGTVKQILELGNIHKMIPTYPSEEAAVGGAAA